MRGVDINYVLYLRPDDLSFAGSMLVMHGTTPLRAKDKYIMMLRFRDIPITGKTRYRE